MTRSSPACRWPVIAVVLTAMAAGGGFAEVPQQPGGRFLYAGDDDWDWATPQGAEKACKLVRYGAMPWSALDWAEEGLEVVRGVLVGTPPNAKKTMSMEELSELRGEGATYQHHPQVPGVFQRLLDQKDPPNVIILMQNTSNGAAPPAGAIATLTSYVRNGGRLVVLDDWQKYQTLLDAFVSEALKLPPGPPIEEPPASKPVEEKIKPGEDSRPAKPAPIDPDLKRTFEELLPALGADKFDTRDQASKGIQALGSAVLPLIEQVETDDPEVAARLAAIEKRLAVKSSRKGKVSAHQEAQRRAKYQRSLDRIAATAKKLRKAKIPHLITEASIDADKRPLPTLRLSWPPPQP